MLIQKPRLTNARAGRGFAYKYYPIKGDDKHRLAVLGGRCIKCGKITDAYCDKCNQWVCENHLIKESEYGCYCLDCGRELKSHT
jgi:hypothetical protein